jgi:uncharacterized OB-fold protein
MTVPATVVSTVPVDDLVDLPAVRTGDGEPELVGSSCHNCGAQAFPRRVHCQKCFSTDLVDIGLDRVGQLYSFTVVRVSSSRPTPYAIGYVDLPGGLRILADLARDQDRDEEFGCDTSVRLEIDDDGWRFRPDEATSTEAEPTEEGTHV